MTKRPPVMGISIYRGDRLLGKALDVTVDGTSLALGPATMDRFEVLRYLHSRATADLMGEKNISSMPTLTLYCDPTTIKGKKKKGGYGEGLVRLGFQPQTIEIDPSMPGQNFSLKSFKGVLVGNIELGVDTPKELAAAAPLEESPTTYY